MTDRRQPPRPSHPTSLPPDVGPIDSNWDDDTMPRFELDDPMSESAFDRVTAIPELPAEDFAKQMMDEQSKDSAPPDHVPSLPREPPLPLIDVPSRDQPVPSSNAQTARPGRPTRGPLGMQPTGLELAEVGPDPPKTARSPSGELRRDPRDPVLELDLSEVARSGPPPMVLMPSPPASPRDTELTEMKDRYAMGDFTGALVVAEGLLEVNADDIDAQRYAQSCRDVLTQMYSARIGALTQRVSVAVPGDQIRWLSLDHRAGFVLSLIDGSSTVEEVLDISGMNRLDALRILYTLFDQRVISLS